MSENKLLSTNSFFEIHQFSLSGAGGNIHDFIPISLNEAVVFTLSIPLEEKKHDAFLFSFSTRSLTRLPIGFIHARNLVSAPFFKNRDDLIIFDHGLDHPPFKGASARFLERVGDAFISNDALFSYPPSFNFSGFTGDWDGDGVPELFVCSLTDKTPHLFANLGHNKLEVIDERLPEILRHNFFKVLSGTSFVDGEHNLHLAVGSCGMEQIASSDLVFKNHNHGHFKNRDLIALPPKRGGALWASIQMLALKNSGGGDDLIINTHDPLTQDGLIDLYGQNSSLKFSYAQESKALYEEKNCWFPRLIATKNQDIIAIKGRGLKEYVKKELNVVYLKKEKSGYVDCSEELRALADKEFVGVAEIKTNSPKASFVLLDYQGVGYECRGL